MTATTFTQQRQPTFPFWIILLGLALALGLVLAINVQPSQHAVERHGTDALAIRNCLDSNGPTEVWRHKTEKDKFIEICQLDDGRWGMRIIRKAEEKFYEITCFCRDNPTYNAITRYLGRFSTRYKGGL